MDTGRGGAGARGAVSRPRGRDGTPGGGAPLPSRRKVLAGLCGAAGLTMVPTLAGRLLLPSATAAGTVSVAVALDEVAGELPLRSMGFSFEKNTIPTPLFSPSNDALIALFRLLGPGVLRLGGNSVDRVTFDPQGPGLTPGVVAPPDLVRLAAFADAVDWQIIYGTPFLFSTAAQVRDEAFAASVALGARLDSFELCNEPDLYVLNDEAKPIAGTRALFDARWTSFAEAIRSALPEAVLCGPSTCFITLAQQTTAAFATTHAGAFSMLTQHYYRGFGFGSQTIDLLLGPDPDLAKGLEIVRTAAAADGLSYRLAETNSFASGGQPGVSNTFASALWGADLCFKAAAHGAAGVNIHNSGAGLGYPAIVTVGGVVTQIRPLYYGLLLVAAAGNGPMPPVHVSGAPTGDGAPLRVHAVQPSATALRVALVNTGAEPLTVDLDAGRSVTAAGVVRLVGPALAATTDVTLAGTTVAIDGTWAPGAPEAASFSGRQVTLTIPAASALLASITVVAPPPTTTTTASPTTASPTTSTNPTSTNSSSPTSSPPASAAGLAATPATPARPVTAAPPFAG